VLTRVSDSAAADSSGWESAHVSRYFSKRCRRKYRRYPKLSACIDTRSHLCLAAVVDRGPKPDDIEFKPLLRAARKRHRFRTLLADCGYDAEHHHRFLNDKLGVIGIIPPTRGRPPKDPDRHKPRGFHRRFLHEHWHRLKPLYGQRWQSESYFSMSKRLLDSFLRSRKRANQDRELHLRNITMNLMLTADP
jgi:Transposase DDE domain